MVRQRRSANRLETEGPQSDEATGEALAESNVIRLPRDWLGPREELVPFGTRAEGPTETAGGESRAPEPPPRAADFWGEESAAVQDALPAPAPAPESPIPQAPRWRTRARAIPPRAGTSRALAAAAVAIAAVLLAVGVFQFGLLGSSHPVGSARPASQASGLAVVFPPALLGVENWPLSHIRAARHPAPAVRRVRVSPSRRIRSLPAQRYIPVSTSSAVTPSQPPPPTTTTTTTTRYIAPAPRPAGGSDTDVASTPPSTAPTYNAPATSAAAGGAKAFGPSGVLGPGSSGNG